VVPQVQASGRRYRLVLNFPNPVCKKVCPGATSTLGVCFYLKVHVSASDGGCATPKPINHPRRTAVVVDSQVVGRRPLDSVGQPRATSARFALHPLLDYDSLL